MLVRINHQAVNLAQLTRQELIELKYQVDQESDDIRDQLKRAEAHLKLTGEYADPNWYWSAVRAQKYRMRLSQTIQGELSKRKGGGRVSLPDYFMDLARQQLEPALFQELWEEAQAKALGQERQHLMNTYSSQGGSFTKFQTGGNTPEFNPSGVEEVLCTDRI